MLTDPLGRAAGVNRVIPGAAVNALHVRRRHVNREVVTALNDNTVVSFAAVNHRIRAVSVDHVIAGAAV